MKLIYLIVSLIILISCKEKPTYNPFDEQTNISVGALKSECKIIYDTCGYFGYEKEIGGITVCYGVHDDEPYKILGKGCYYNIDSVKIGFKCNNYSKNEVKDSVLSLPIDVVKMNNDFKRFGYRFLTSEKVFDKTLKMNNWYIHLVNNEKKDTVIFSYNISLKKEQNDFVVRSMAYGKPF